MKSESSLASVKTLTNKLSRPASVVDDAYSTPPDMPRLRSRLHQARNWVHTRLQSVRNRLQRRRQQQQSTAGDQASSGEVHRSPQIYNIYTHISEEVPEQLARLALEAWANDIYDGSGEPEREVRVTSQVCKGVERLDVRVVIDMDARKLGSRS